jgi:hypothetical protein
MGNRKAFGHYDKNSIEVPFAKTKLKIEGCQREGGGVGD